MQSVEAALEQIYDMERTKFLVSDAISLVDGGIVGLVTVNKFGRANNVNGEFTDIWDRANTVDDQAIWVAPTQARIHDIVSANASDAAAGVGARTLEVFGLTAWDADEVSEDIVMNGTTNVPTENAYVIIHRMRVLTKGATSVNVGRITATAQTDGTVTAEIYVGQGQTQMAIYGIPSTKNAYMTAWWAGLNRATEGAADMYLLENPEPNEELTNFLVKHTFGLKSLGTGYIRHLFKPYFKVSGPVILKVTGWGVPANMDISAGFDLILKAV
jgi:hypothetical protein